MTQCHEFPKPNKDNDSRLLIRPIKVAILGAGSAAFARRLMTDLLCVPGLEQGTFALVDIDSERLDLARRMGERLVGQSGRRRFSTGAGRPHCRRSCSIP